MSDDTNPTHDLAHEACEPRWKCLRAHDACEQMMPGPNCPYCVDSHREKALAALLNTVRAVGWPR